MELQVPLDNSPVRSIVMDDLATSFEQVRDRRKPAAAILLILLALFLALMGGLVWKGISVLQGPIVQSAVRERAAKIRQVQMDYRRAPVALGDPADIPVVPVRLQDLTQDEARQLNASIPFSLEPRPAAHPFTVTLESGDLLKAIDCLAAATWYEAGDDPVGQRAVAQVVLNRVRHPAFPKTVCGVVFQGSERQTGCQFSFTCDGSMRRIPSAPAWARARQIATRALTGYVFAPVGYATHYHTDWVAPYWSAKVDKIARVGTHLFFRWMGKAGRPEAFNGRYAGSEAVIPSLMSLSIYHSSNGIREIAPADSTMVEPAAAQAVQVAASGLPEAPQPAHVTAQNLRGNRLLSYEEGRNRYDIAIADEAKSGGLALMALDLCSRSGQAPCEVHARVDSQAGPDDFRYYRDASRNYEVAEWNCRKFARPDPAQCMSGTAKP